MALSDKEKPSWVTPRRDWIGAEEERKRRSAIDPTCLGSDMSPREEGEKEQGGCSLSPLFQQQRLCNIGKQEIAP